jgi:signal transduction histidine kinase
VTLSLRTWLALGLLLATAVPAAAGMGAWIAAGQWQADREVARRAAAAAAVAGASLDTAAQRGALRARLAALRVEAQLSPAGKEVAFTGPQAPGSGPVGKVTGPLDNAKRAALGREFITPGLDAILQTPDGKQRLNDDFASMSVDGTGLGGMLFVRHEPIAARWAIALGIAALGLAVALALAVALLSRWVLRPLARLAGDADRIAGGELTAAPGERPPTRAREVAQVGEALHGMAGALGSALGASVAAERDRRFLVSAIAHDLRTPLFTLRGSLEAIEHGHGDPDSLARAQRKAAHLDRLVGDLFAFARAEYAEPASEPVDLAAIARRAAETVEPGPIRLEVAGGRAPLHGDPVALQRVLTNLLENAIRHARTRVDVTVSPGRVEVADDGPGFTRDDLPHVFEPLFRGDRARSGGRAGLGLAIARRLARAHGGEVEAANGATGARVTVTLPLAAAPAAPVSLPTSRFAAAGES